MCVVRVADWSMTVCWCCDACGGQNPNCINSGNTPDLVTGTINGVIQPSSIFKFKSGFLTFEIELAPGEDAEFCIVFDPSVSFDVSNAINENGYDVLLKGGHPTDTGKWTGWRERREM